MKYSLVALFTTVSILFVILAITISANHYLYAQTKGENISTAPKTVSVDLNETGDEILEGTALSEAGGRARLHSFVVDGRTGDSVIRHLHIAWVHLGRR